MGQRPQDTIVFKAWPAEVTPTITAPASFEVRRILKAYVDAQTLSDFSERLSAYAGAAEGASP